MDLLFCIKAMNNPGGGAERVLADIANGLFARGHRISVLTFEQAGGTSFYKLAPEIARVNIAIGSTVAPATASETVRRIIALRRELLKRKPDAAIGFMHSMFLSLAVAATRTDVPVIASEHIVPMHYKSRPLEWQLMRIVPYLVERITCTSHQIRDTYPASIQRKMVPIPNPITVPRSGRADVAGGRGATKTLLSVGRLEEQKDFATLIRAFAAVHRQLPDWRLRIVGEGRLRPDLEQLVSRLDLTDKVSLPGAISDIGSEYMSAQVVVLPSLYESFGLSVAEALAHGLPAIGFKDCLGVNALIRDGENGLLVGAVPDRITALAQALLTLLGDAALRERLAASAISTRDDFDYDSIVGTWEDMICSLVNNKVVMAS